MLASGSGLLRRGRGQAARIVPGATSAGPALLDARQVVGHEVDDLVGRAPERLGVHVPVPASWAGCEAARIGHASISSSRCELVAISATAASKATRLRSTGGGSR